MTPDEFFARVYAEPSRLEDGCLCGHVLGAPVEERTLKQWRRRFPAALLPADLVALVRRWNGLHLGASLEECGSIQFGRSYEGLAPVEEWDFARRAMYGDAEGDEPDDGCIAISYHRDGAYFIVLDSDSGRYYGWDSCGWSYEDSEIVAESIEDLLDYFWKGRG